MNNPYNLEDEGVILEPSSYEVIERGDRTIKDYLRELLDYDEEELERIFWSMLVLTQKADPDGWVTVQGAYPEGLRAPWNWMLMALDTGMIWERG